MLRYVVANIRKQALEAVVKDRIGKFRKIVLTWKSKEKSPPPEDWADMVRKECEFQISHPSKEEGGGWLR